MKRPWYILREFLLLIPLLNQSYGNRAPLFFEKEPNNMKAVTGKSATFYCKAVAAGKRITYFWKLNGSFINEDNDNGFKISDGSLHIFDIVGTRNGGGYECIAFNEDLGAIKSRKAMLQIAYFSNATHPKKDQFVKPSDAFLLQVPVYKAFPAPTFVWQYGVRRAGRLYEYVNVTSHKDLFITLKGDLLISHVQMKHMKNYRVNVYHPVSGNRIADDFYVNLHLTSSGLEECRDKAMISFPTVQKKTVHEGSTVSFDCLAVPKSCKRETLINWTKIGSHRKNLNETSRRLVMNNVTKKNNEGTYQCQAHLDGEGDTITITFVLSVIERPKLFKAVSPNLNLSADGIMFPAIFNNTESFSWYKDGEIINNRSALFEVFANGSIRIKDPSPAFSGIYQMFYQNQAGTAVVSQEVRVGSEVGCGWKISNMSGIVSYARTSNLLSDFKCTWIFQVPTTDYMQFNMTTFNVPIVQRKKAILSFYSGSSASGAPVEKYYFNTTTPLPIAIVKGPFITMLFLGMTSSVGGFTLRYEPRPWAPKMTTTTIAPTTTRKSTKSDPSSKNVMTSKSTFSKHGTTAATTKLSTPQSIPTKEPQKKDDLQIDDLPWSNRPNSL